MSILKRTGLRQLLWAIGTVVTVGGGLATTALLYASHALQRDLRRDTDAILQEHELADRIREGVHAQVSQGRAYLDDANSGTLEQFRRHGREVYARIRSYLVHDLSAAERDQIERIRELHEKLEVAGRPAFDLRQRGDREGAHRRAALMFSYATDLEEAMNEFTSMALNDHARLQRGLASTFGTVQLVTALFAVLLIGGFLSAVLLLDWRLSPVREMAAATRRLGMGDLDVRVPVLADDEIGELARSLNDSAARLKRTRRQVRHRNRQLSRALARLKRTQQELVQGEKMRAMGVMLAGLAHELNNPLASVLGYAELLRDEVRALGENGARELQEMADPIVAEAHRARALVQNLLQFSRKSADDVQAVDLRASIEAVAALRRYAFAQEGITLDVDVPADTAVHAEPVRFQQAVLNLVNNAFDALRENGGSRVLIRVRPDGARWITVTVEDDGSGLKDPDRVFDPFYTTKAVGSGTGLGLALVRRFLEEWGGTITGENRPQGGARFTMRLLRADGATPERDRPAASKPSDLTEAVGSPIAVSAPTAGTKRVLVVEDEAPLLRLQVRLLSRLGCEVLTSSAATDARDLIAAQHVDVVISDIKMPGEMDGLGLYRWTAESRPELAERFLLVTGNLHDPSVRDLVDAAPSRFIGKPFDVQEYLDRVGALLS